MHVAIAAHSEAIDLEGRLEAMLVEMGHQVREFGLVRVDGSEDDPAAIARLVAERVASGDFERGIVIADEGYREVIEVNREEGVRGALCGDLAAAETSRRAADANLLVLPLGRTDFDDLLAITRVWLETPCERNARPRRRTRPAVPLSIDGDPLPNCAAAVEDAPFVCDRCRTEFHVPVDVTAGSDRQLVECPVCDYENIVVFDVDPLGAVDVHPDPRLTE